jgi:hypothetical protein
MEQINNRTESNQKYKMNPDEMWKTMNLNTDAGIEGYEINKKYFDYLKLREYKKNWERNTSDKVRNRWPPQELRDGEGNIKWPKKKNYLDDVINKLKIAKIFF